MQESVKRQTRNDEVPYEKDYEKLIKNYDAGVTAATGMMHFLNRRNKYSVTGGAV